MGEKVTTLQSRGWLFAGILALVLLVLISIGWWRGTGTGAQVQVPMFYDAHYLFPRPWTQQQSAPGIPDPAGLAFYGDNRVSQTFVSGMDRLSMVELWLAGESSQVVEVALTDGERVIATEVLLSHGRDGGRYPISFPPFENAQDDAFVLMLHAPGATAESPVTTRTIGGDRLGGTLRINEYLRPGNLEIQTYGRGLPGLWWLEAIGEQLLPSAFRLRLQQYKPMPFKGGVFTGLLVLTGMLTVGLLVLAAPTHAPSLRTLSQVLGWSLALLLGLFLAWQVGTGRVRLPLLTQPVAAQSADTQVAIAPAAGADGRLVDDFTAVLWTAVREPEARFVATELVNGLPAVRVPAESRLSFGRTLPPNGRLRAGLLVPEDGVLRMTVRVGGEDVATQSVAGAADGEIVWLDLDLAQWGGLTTAVELITEPVEGTPDGLWIMPQLSARADWLLAEMPPEAAPDGSVLAERVALAGYTAVQDAASLDVTLFWEPLAATDAYATVFVHVLNEAGEIVAQHDGQPVGGAYPFPLWQPGGVVVADRHLLALPDDLPAGRYTLSVGVYDSETFERWPVTLPDGTVGVDGRVLLQPPIEISR